MEPVDSIPRRLNMAIFSLSILLFTITLHSGCAPMESKTKPPEYKETKQMVLDILRTEDGKKAIQEIMIDEESKSKLILGQEEIKKSIQETLLSSDNKEKLQKLMNDPQFVKEYAKQLEEENKKLIKSLMKDPDYKTAMMEILKDPEMEKQFLELTKSKEFRQQTMTVMKEAMESPYFRLELLELLSKVTEQMEGKSSKEGKGGGKEGKQSGGG